MTAQPAAAQAARAALDAWLAAARDDACDQAVALLARSSPLWAGRDALEEACRQGEAAWQAWKHVQADGVVWSSDDRVVFRLTGAAEPTFAVMVQEEGQWRYAGDVLRTWEPRPARCEQDGVQVLWGPAWDRATGVSVPLTLTNATEAPLSWGAACATLHLADGTALNADPCPQVTVAPGEAWQGELFFPKLTEGQGQPWSAPPKRVVLQNLSFADGAARSLTCTWRAP